MLALGIIVLAIGAVVVFFTCGYSKQYRNFSNEMRSRTDATKEISEYCSDDEINQLPTCLKDFCTFDKEHGVLRYESAQRQEPEVEDGKTIPVGWRCEGGNFHDGKEFKIPSYCKVTKIYPDREVVYFDAKEYEMELEK